MEDNYIINEGYKPNKAQPEGYDRNGNWIGIEEYRKRRLASIKYRIKINTSKFNKKNKKSGVIIEKHEDVAFIKTK